MNDAELISGILAGQDAAKEALYRTYRQRLYATACHFLGWQDAEAEDAVQDTFMAALQGLAGFEGRSSLYTWLNHICVNHCYGRLRARQRQVATQKEDLELLLKPEAASQEQDLRSQRLQGWIGSLGKDCRELIGLRFISDLAIAEIKERLKLPIGTVASRLARCQEKLKKIAHKGMEHG